MFHFTKSNPYVRRGCPLSAQWSKTFARTVGFSIWTQSERRCNFERVLISLKRGRRIFGEVSRSGMSTE
jgi:hypothetical protein